MIPGYLLKIPVLSSSILMTIIYYWSRANPDQPVSFMFGLTFKATLLPWVMVAFTTLLGGNPLTQIIGIVVGHIYYLLADRVPVDYGYHVVSTPHWISDLFGDPPAPTYHPQGGQYQPPQPDAGPRGPRYAWGAGQRLGNQ